LYGPGTLFNIGFDVIGAQGKTSPIDFITGITTTVIYDEDDLLHPVPLSLEAGSLTVGNNYTRGDVNGDTVVNVADALSALCISAGQITPTPQQQGVCDVNGDGTCTAADATLIRCYSAGSTWSRCGVAVTSSIPPSAPPLRGHGVSGMERIEMQSNASRAIPVTQAPFAQPASFDSATLRSGRFVSDQSNIVRLGLGTTSAGQAVTTTVTIANGQEFAGGTLTFQYNPNALTFNTASLASLTSGFNAQSYVLQPGLVRVALARDTAINADGAILNLRFTATANLPEARSLREGIDLSSVRLNDAAGRDFVTSALQKQIEIVSQYRVYLPLVAR
jgi:hypothetical protein